MLHVFLTFPKLRNGEIRSFKLPAPGFGTTTCIGLCRYQGLVLEALALIRREMQIIQNLCEVFLKKQTKPFFVSLTLMDDFLLTEWVCSLQDQCTIYVNSVFHVLFEVGHIGKNLQFSIAAVRLHIMMMSYTTLNLDDIQVFVHFFLTVIIYK